VMGGKKGSVAAEGFVKVSLVILVRAETTGVVLIF
jgi:hypothetical protein